MEQVLIPAIVAVVVLAVANAAKYIKAKKQPQAKNGHSKTAPGKANPDYSGMKTKDLCCTVLESLNCELTYDEEDDDRMTFEYQGETFCLTATNDCLIATIYDFSWGSVDVNDIDEMSNLRKAINTVNLMYNGTTVAYTMDTTNNRMVVHTKRSILMTPEIPNLKGYMQAMLMGFFETQRRLSNELDQLRQKTAATK